MTPEQFFTIGKIQNLLIRMGSQHGIPVPMEFGPYAATFSSLDGVEIFEVELGSEPLSVTRFRHERERGLVEFEYRWNHPPTDSELIVLKMIHTIEDVE